MKRGRVLLVEDDPAIRRFVSMALHSLQIDLSEAATLAEARRALDGAAFDLLLTDLALPDGNGADMLTAWHRRPREAGRDSPRVVVFSAGVATPVRQQLLEGGVWQILDKPVSLQALLDCVQSATRPSPASAAHQPEPVPNHARFPAHERGAAAADEAAAIAHHFGGQESLFLDFKAACIAQFADDLARGDAARMAHDLPTLQRVAHTLKTVLQLLGSPRASECARALERSAADHQGPCCQRLWSSLREDLISLRAGT
jgi:CheY-like chemotaxis protein/HPt (histidine-containing phosphotransfer) domain-containing protein